MLTDILFFIRWYIASLLLSFVFLPITFRVFIHLPDRGYSFTKPLSLLFTGYVFWFLGANRFLYYDLGGIFLSIAVIIGLGIGFQRKDGLQNIRDWIIEHKSFVFLVEIFFLLLFAGWAYIQTYSPDIYGTEKPMEFMFINSILRSSTFPPQDAWLSDHAISYYYFGYFIMATLSMITNTPSSIAFNLGIALIFALTGITSSGVVMNLIALVKREGGKQSMTSSHILVSSFWSSLLGPVLILIVGNWYGAFELAHNNGFFADTQIPMIWYDYGQAIDGIQVKSLDDYTQKPGIRIGMTGFWEWLDLKQLQGNSVGTSGIFQWDLPNWFFAARVVHDRNLIGVETEAIDEMPAFSFLLADMHPHVLAIPFVITAIALALEWLLTAMATPIKVAIQAFQFWFPWDRFLLTAIPLGGLLFLNTWDFPIYWFLMIASFTIGLGLNWKTKSLINYWKYPLFFSIGLLGASLVLYWPFLLTFQSQAGGILPNLIYPTRLQQIIVMFGPVLSGISIFLVWLTYQTRNSINRRLVIFVTAGVILLLGFVVIFIGLAAILRPEVTTSILSLISPLTRSEALSLILQRRLVDSGTSITAALIIGCTIGIICVFLNISQPKRLFPDENELKGKNALVMILVMILTGSLLLIGPEFVYLRDNFGTRMNTLFKFYFQIWALWGIASGFIIWYIWQFAGKWFRKASALLWCVCIVLGAYYLFGSLLNKTAYFSNPKSLDGMAYFARIYPDDGAAIDWLQQNAQDGQVILEGSKGAYWMDGPSSRFSMATGLPTVMGWYNHEAQWRGEYIGSVEARLGDIQTIYQSRDWALTQRILDQYKIEYVIIGSFEKDLYNPVYLAKFDRYMSLVFTSGDVLIYSR